MRDFPQKGSNDMMSKQWLLLTVFLLFAASSISAQSRQPTSADASAFIGTWVITYTEPPEFKTTHTVTIRNQNGVVAASIQAGNTLEVTGILKDGNLLVLTINRDAPSAMRENGAPIWSVLSLSLEGDTMKAALMLEPSRTIKKGTGKKQGN
jgi:hypothetical protein